MDISDEWVHTVVNFIALNNGEEIRIYHDGNLIRSKTMTTRAFNLPANDNRKIVIGRAFTGLNEYYASVYVDEMLFYNQSLTVDEIVKLSRG